MKTIIAILIAVFITGCATRRCKQCEIKDDLLEFYEADAAGMTNSTIHQMSERVYEIRRKRGMVP